MARAKTSESAVIAEIVSEISDIDVETVQRNLSGLRTENMRLAEALENIEMMLDQRGFAPLFDYSSHGLSRAQVQTASKQLRELVVGNPTMKRGSQARNAYIWGKGVKIEFEDMSKLAQKKILALTATPSNQLALFSKSAKEELERAAYTDGNFFLLGDDKTKKLTRIPVWEITGAITDPDNHDVLWALQRTWQRMNGLKAETVESWYWTDTYDEGTTGTSRPKVVTGEGGDETVDVTKTIFWQGYNRQVGWLWGVADALPAIAWARLWREFLESGHIMSKAMARIAYKLTAKTQAGLAGLSATVANAEGSGNSAGMSSTMDMVPLATAGKGYDFESGQSLAGMVAAALGLTQEELLALPNTEKSDGIPGSVLREMKGRQGTQAEFIKRILVWFGAPFLSVEVCFPSIEDTDPFRKWQMATGNWGTGLFSPDESRENIAEASEWELEDSSAPQGVLIPNNANSVAQGELIKTTDTDGNTTTVQKTGGPGGSGGPAPDGSNSQSNGQGRNSQGTGKQSDGNNDLRDGTTVKKK